MNEEKKEKDAILIVGDWVVDEFWFLVRHHSDFSSHTGLVHYRLACEKDDIVWSIGGTGNIARVLYRLRYEENENYQLVGLGKWHENDTEFFGHLIHSRDPKEGDSCYAGSANFIIKPQICKTKPNIALITLKKDSPTLRIVRLYHQEDGGIEQINRVDWEPERKRREKDNNELDELNLPRKEQVKFIVICDLRKGVVTASLIEFIKKRYPVVMK